MKKVIVLVVVVSFVCFALVACAPQGQTNEQFLRIHIRADSNSTNDQNAKYAVKCAVVDYLTPLLVNATTKNQAMQVVDSNLSGITAVCNKVLVEQGMPYVAKARLAVEQFPDRSYNGVVLSSGVYDALVVELGSGKGDNWWCVVYPPLCFVGGESNGTNKITYKSKLLEIIARWKNRNQ